MEKIKIAKRGDNILYISFNDTGEIFSYNLKNKNKLSLNKRDVLKNRSAKSIKDASMTISHDTIKINYKGEEFKKIVNHFNNNVKIKDISNCFKYPVVTSLIDYLNVLQSCESENNIYYRGVNSKKFNPYPSIIFNYEGKTSSEIINLQKELFDKFEFRFKKDLIDLNYLEKLCLMRHHGVSNCLLDVTSNPLVALYFACGQSKDKDDDTGAVYIFSVPKTSSITTTERFLDVNEPFKKGFEMKYPFHLRVATDDPRIIAQSGSFIVCNLEKKDDIFENGISLFKKILIFDKIHILKELDILKINKANLFPDMDNYAEYLEEKNKQFY